MQQTAAIFVSVDKDQNKILYIDCISTFLSLDDCFLDSAISCRKTKSWKESCLVGYSIDVSMSVGCSIKMSTKITDPGYILDKIIQRF